MRYVLPVLGLLVVFLSWNPVAADDIRQVFALGEPMTFAQRQSLAQEWQQDFQKLDDAVPFLSPSQVEWLRREYDEELAQNNNQFTRRALNAMNTKEIRLRRTKAHTQSNANIIEPLANGSTKDHLRREAMLWTALAANLLNVEAIQALNDLAGTGVIEPSLIWHQSDDERLMFANYMLQAEMILKNLVLIPYAIDSQSD